MGSQGNCGENPEGSRERRADWLGLVTSRPRFETQDGLGAFWVIGGEAERDVSCLFYKNNVHKC
ncbi:hypothetical protein TcasGA2_TC031320 [Tribolium castaneum]|uniref:Uncharacterized protein n=1 Tax=Tribolium castaneum TaxID=7070 RepID=A0A139W8D7_TRICA|nr:hypothetical protein TcasGA2_TC031320 [Tribolium castaneum]